MPNNPVNNKFIFPGSTQSLFAALRQILDFINYNLPYNADAATINFKVKVIVTELLNNAVKHADNAETTIEVLINNQHIRIEKTDQGTRFNPNNLLTESSPVHPQTVQLSMDALNTLFLTIGTAGVIRFFCQEQEIDDTLDINKINEHFGLLIIAKSADEFTYQYDTQSKSNKFSAVLHLA